MPTTRYYIDSAAPAVTVAAAAAWSATSWSVKKALSTTRPASTTTIGGTDDFHASGAVRLLQGVTDTFAAGVSLSGTVAAVVQVSETNAALDSMLRMIVRLVSSDGATVRATLADVTGTTEFGTTKTSRMVSAALTSTTTQAGDRVVFEIGASRAPSPGVNFYVGSYSSPDLPENETTTTDGIPWMELRLSNPDTLKAKVGTSDPAKFYVGSTAATALYVGESLVYKRA